MMLPPLLEVCWNATCGRNRPWPPKKMKATGIPSIPHWKSAVVVPSVMQTKCCEALHPKKVAELSHCDALRGNASLQQSCNPNKATTTPHKALK
mmetsp:Transcript_41226/g.92580  ORF Transcript_41226/g.92580 Transcript_41226/m.92580 type:complete len:94 (+) Transcript_41226:87-368(+)